MKFCLIGERLSHSYSERIHSLCGVKYDLCEVPKGKLKDFVKSNNYDGFNVTIPYKKDIIEFLDEIDQTAKEIGAVNTVVRRGDKLIGYNTDIFGMEFMIKEAGISLKDKNVLVLGTGGAGQMAMYCTKKLGAKTVNSVSRNGTINYQNVYEMSDTQVIINATPIGMYPNNYEKPLDPCKFPKLLAIIDTIYNPNITELMFIAEKSSVKTASGLKMLVAQAVKAEQLWRGKSFSDREILDICDKLLSEKQNIILIGMPSSGKSTIGKMASEFFGREFIDTDKEIYNRTNLTPSQIIEKDGEEAFRNIESEVIKEVSKNNSLIIATGGGSVLREENRKALKQNGIIVYIKRDLELLVSNDRPLSKEKGIEKLYLERKDIYQNFADVIIENNSTKEKCLEELKNFL